MQNEFQKRIEEYGTNLIREQAQFNKIGYFKLFLVLLWGFTIYVTFSKGFPVILIAAIIAELFIIIPAWVYHHRLNKKIEYFTGLVTINEKHIDRISGNWVTFEDAGKEFIDEVHPYASDLDIVGPKSFFQFLNTTHTWHGRQAFANDLLYPEFSTDELGTRQQAIAELSEDIDFLNDVEYHFSQIGADSAAKQFVEELKNDEKLMKNVAIKYVFKCLPLVLLLSICAVSLFPLKNLYVIPILLVGLQGLIWIAAMPKNYQYLHTVSHALYKPISYCRVIDVLNDKGFQSENLKQIQARLTASNYSASQAIKELGSIHASVRIRQNGIVYFILSLFLLWDFQCAFAFEKWKMKYAPLAEDWFLALGEFESLLCFAHFPSLCNHTCLPSPVDGKKIYAEKMGHPLIHNEVRIYNNVTCNNGIFIISGSNMSGKTTYLRTIGINMVLARTGSFVCAEKMKFSLLYIMTSMRITDDLSQGISTFYAELKRIKTILDFAKKEDRLLFLIDEIFRGTNSVDRISGAKKIISTLNKLHTVGFISTHDLELCELTTQYSAIKNYSFSEQYKDNTIQFDYKIKPGKSTTTNAEYLMKMVGIVE